MDLIPAEIDQYLDFCTRALLGRNPRCMSSPNGMESYAKLILAQDPLVEGTFPVSAPSETQPTSSPWPVTVAGGPGDSFPSPDVEPQEQKRLPRGKRHTVYCTNDILGDLPEDYRLVVSQAARWCGVSNDDIALVVERFERRLLRDLERGPKSGGTTLKGRHEYSDFDNVD